MFGEEQIVMFKANRMRSANDSFYGQNRNILIHAEHEHSPQIIFCGNPNHCRKRFLCRSCSRYKSYLLTKDVDHIPVENMYFITISHKNPISIESDFYINSIFFTSYRRRIRKLYRGNVLAMFVGSQEVSIRTLYPKIGINPHIHLIVMASNVDTVVNSFLKSNLSIDVAAIPNPEELRSRIAYMYKPVNLVAPYLQEFDKDPVRVNRNMCSFLTQYSMLILGRPQSYRDLSSFKYTISSLQSFIGADDESPCGDSIDVPRQIVQSN